MERVDVGNGLAVEISAVLLAQLDDEVALFHTVVEGANLCLVAAKLVAVDSFVLIGVVQTLYCGVALATL